MSAAKLSRVRWSVGQILLPEHFRALEGSLSTEGAMRMAAAGLPAHGVYRLVWNAEGPQGSVLWVGSLLAVLPSGELVDVPGNAEISGPLDLNAAGRSEVEVYLHLFDAPSSEGEAFEPKGSPDVPRVMQKAELSTQESLPNSRARIKLGEFKKPLGGGFGLSGEHIPPLVRVGTTPYLSERLRVLQGELYGYDEALVEVMAHALTEGDSTRAALRVRLEIMKLIAILEDIRRGVAMHPYTLFDLLRAFLLELYLLEGEVPVLPAPVYDHEALGRAFSGLMSRLSDKLKAPPLRSPHVEFVVESGRFIAADLPEELLKAREIYLLIQKSSALDKVLLEGVRLASPTRLRAVHEHALRGVRILPVPEPTFRHSFGSAVDFYRLATHSDESPEWQHVVSERALCFYAKRELMGIRAALFWRRP